MIAAGTTTAAVREPSKQASRASALLARIAQQATDDQEICFAPAPVFTHTSLPSRDPGPNITAWVRRNGDAALVVTPGVRVLPDGTVQSRGFPWGTTPRLVLYYLATEAIRTKCPRIELGGSLTEFLRRVGLAQHSYQYRAVREQIGRLFSANIKYSFRGKDHLEIMSNCAVADDYVLWWDAAQADQHTLWRSYVILHGRFFREVLEHGFPLDLTAVRALHQCVLALMPFGYYRRGAVLAV